MTRKKTDHEFTIAHLFAGIGGGAYGSAQARVRIGDHYATFRTLGGVDFNKEACQDFEYMVDAPCKQADISTMQPEELREVWGDEAPDMLLLSPPCKGFSGLLSKKRAAEDKYQKLNKLVLEGLHLACATWEKPPAIIFLENVPRITAATRGKHLLVKVRQLLRAYGYVVTGDDEHDCGEIGGLAQHRKRFFLVARDPARIPNFIYQPGKHRVRGCGEVIGKLPPPGDIEAGGRMHELPNISWLNWIRLALIPAGGDWRDLPGVVPKGKTRRQVHKRHRVEAWDEPTGTVAGSGSNSVNNVADPRLIPGLPEKVQLKSSGTNASSYKGRPGLFGVNDWSKPSATVTANMTVSGSNTPASIADPRPSWGGGKGSARFGMLSWDSPTGAITGNARPSTGKFSIADPRVKPVKSARNGAYGVLHWTQAAGTITGHHKIDNSKASVADPRISGLKATKSLSSKERRTYKVRQLGKLNDLVPEDMTKAPDFIPVIIAPDGTWHRPLTILELAALQGFPMVHKGRPFELCGDKRTAWRERVGNAIPPPAAAAVASEMLLALLAAEIDHQQLRADDIWVEGLEGDPIYTQAFLAHQAKLREREQLDTRPALYAPTTEVLQ